MRPKITNMATSSCRNWAHRWCSAILQSKTFTEIETRHKHRYTAMTLMDRLEKNLKIYSVGLEFWEPHAGDTFLLIDHRRFLQNHLDDLSAEQTRRLRVADGRVLDFASRDYAEVTGDVEVLGTLVELLTPQDKE